MWNGWAEDERDEGARIYSKVIATCSQEPQTIAGAQGHGIPNEYTPRHAVTGLSVVRASRAAR